MMDDGRPWTQTSPEFCGSSETMSRSRRPDVAYGLQDFIRGVIGRRATFLSGNVGRTPT